MVKRKGIIIFVGIAALGIGIAAATNVIPPRHFGPYYCGTCLLEPRMPDPSTLAFLNQYRQKMLENRDRLFTGDSISVCSRGFCTTYTITDTGDFWGGGTMSNASPIGGGGGPGGGVGGGGGGGGGSTGVVTVGPGTPVALPMEPCKFGDAIRWVPVGGCDF